MNIDAFVAQPYPLEHSTDGETWQLVLGWTGEEDGIMPVLASELPGHYRAGSSRPAASSAAVAAPSRPVGPARRAPQQSA